MTLSDWKERHGLSDQQLADMIGVTQGTISKYLNGRIRPGWSTIARIVRATNGAVTANDFLPPLPADDDAEAPS